MSRDSRGIPEGFQTPQQLPQYRWRDIHSSRGGAARQLVGLITQRSQVQILSPLPNSLEFACSLFEKVVHFDRGNSSWQSALNAVKGRPTKIPTCASYVWRARRCLWRRGRVFTPEVRRLRSCPKTDPLRHSRQRVRARVQHLITVRVQRQLRRRSRTQRKPQNPRAKSALALRATLRTAPASATFSRFWDLFWRFVIRCAGWRFV